MLDTIKDILRNEGITNVGMLSIEDCDIINARILPVDAKSAILFSIPYRSVSEIPEDGFSEYARIYDYHKFCSNLYERTISLMKEKTGYNFYGFCDHSPINEKLAIAKCGLGVIGRNSLYIDNEYGSFVFLGSIITDAICNESPLNVNSCVGCGICISSCPNNAILDCGIDRYKCLSGISQKKNKSDEEKAVLKEHNIVWGCDICQNVCPHNTTAKISPISYFKETRISNIDREFIDSLTDEEFNKYAFSYKGKKIVSDNIDFK